MIAFLISLLLAGVIVVPIAAGLYLLCIPSHRLGVAYMNLRHRQSSFAPLKDEHFSSLPRILVGFKLLGMVLLMTGLAGIYLAVRMNG